MATPFSQPGEILVADDIEFFLGLTLHIDRAPRVGVVVAQHAAEFTKSNGTGNGFAGQGDIQYQRVEVATGTGETSPFFNEVLRERKTLGQRHEKFSR